MEDSGKIRFLLTSCISGVGLCLLGLFKSCCFSPNESGTAHTSVEKVVKNAKGTVCDPWNVSKEGRGDPFWAVGTRGCSWRGAAASLTLISTAQSPFRCVDTKIESSLI